MVAWDTLRDWQSGRIKLIHRPTWTIANTCYLQDLFVTPAHRGTGAERALITHVTQAAQTVGCADIYWLTHQTNTTAMRLYDRIATKTGFLQYQRPISP